MSELNLKQKLIEIRKKVDFLQKDTKGYNYSYVKEEAILMAIKEKMNELQVLLEPHIKDHGVSDFQYLTKAGNSVTESIVSGDMLFVWVDATSEETREIDWALYGQNRDASQALGSGLTYCIRYFLLKYFNVATSKDDPDQWRQKQDEKEDEEYAKSLKRLKDNLPKKLEAECPDNEELLHKATRMTLAIFGFENWKALKFGTVKETDFIDEFVTIVRQEKMAMEEIE